ncbi:hypothetical protein GCM10008997_07900 [Halomonas salifodinae]
MAITKVSKTLWLRSRSKRSRQILREVMGESVTADGEWLGSQGAVDYPLSPRDGKGGNRAEAEKSVVKGG